MKSLIFTFCILFASNIFAQDKIKNNNADLIYLKKLLFRATSDTAKTRLANKISTAYTMTDDIDSCKKYASIAINFTKNLPYDTQNSKLNLKHKRLRAKALQNLGIALSYENITTSLATLYNSLKLWEEIGDQEEIAIAYYSIAQAYSIKGDAVASIEYFNKSLSIYEVLKNDFYVANSLYKISLEKRNLGLYGDALEYSIKSLKVAEKIKDTFSITNALMGNGFNYMFTKKFPEARIEQTKALKLFEKNKDLSGIARAYCDLGTIDRFDNKFKSSLKNHKIALEMRKKLGNANDISISYNYVSDINRRLGNFNEALIAQKAGIPYAIKYGDIRFIIDSYMNTGDIYSDLKDYKNALVYYHWAKEIAIKNNSKNYQAEALAQIGVTHRNMGDMKKAIASFLLADKTVLSTEYKVRKYIYQEITKTFIQNKDYKNGYENQVKFQQMTDSINANEKAEKITSLTQNLIYENKRALQKASQDKEIAVQQSQIAEQKFVRNLSIVGLIIGIGLALLFFMRFKEKRKLNIALEKSLIDLKTTQTQLVQSEKMASLGELTAGIAHEIQNPLNFVNNFSEVSAELLQEMQDEINNGNFSDAKELVNDVVENLNKIKYHGKRADGIVKGMLQHSRKNTGVKELTDLNTLCDEYLRLSYHGLRAQEKTFNATLNTDFDETIGEINIIPQDFGRVILNLLTNAFYAVNEKKQIFLISKEATGGYKPTVSISTKKENEKIIVKINDNGNGMPQEIIDKIFEPFFTTKPNGKGTGLGLSMSYEIITTGHQGELKVESIENEGTEFTISLPI